MLAALPAAELRRLARHLELFPLRLGEALYRPGEPLQHAHFPTTAIVSLRFVLESGASAEIASVGNEGMLGISLFLGGSMSTGSAVVQTAGLSYRIKANWAAAGVQSRWKHPVFVAALCARDDRPDWPDGRL